MSTVLIEIKDSRFDGMDPVEAQQVAEKLVEQDMLSISDPTVSSFSVNVIADSDEAI